MGDNVMEFERIMVRHEIPSRKQIGSGANVISLKHASHSARIGTLGGNRLFDCCTVVMEVAVMAVYSAV